MGDFSTFFKESDISVGVFYPKHYIIATFPKYTAAKNACQALRNAGFREDEAMVGTGRDFLEFFKHFREDAGLWGSMMRPVSRFFGTEASFADRDVQNAEDGAGFVAVHSLTDQETARIQELMAPTESTGQLDPAFAPSSMEWYLPSGIRSLI